MKKIFLKSKLGRLSLCIVDEDFIECCNVMYILIFILHFILFFSLVSRISHNVFCFMSRFSI